MRCYAIGCLLVAPVLVAGAVRTDDETSLLQTGSGSGAVASRGRGLKPKPTWVLDGSVKVYDAFRHAIEALATGSGAVASRGLKPKPTWVLDGSVKVYDTFRHAIEAPSDGSNFTRAGCSKDDIDIMKRLRLEERPHILSTANTGAHHSVICDETSCDDLVCGADDIFDDNGKTKASDLHQCFEDAGYSSGVADCLVAVCVRLQDLCWTPCAGQAEQYFTNPYCTNCINSGAPDGLVCIANSLHISEDCGRAMAPEVKK